MCREYSLWFGLKVGLMVYGLGCMDLDIRFRVQDTTLNHKRYPPASERA